MTSPNAHNENVDISMAAAAIYLNLSIYELAGQIDRGTGPPRIRVGDFLRFRVGDLDRWMQERD